MGPPSFAGIALSLLLVTTSYSGLDDYLLYRNARRGFESALVRASQSRFSEGSGGAAGKLGGAKEIFPPWGKGLRAEGLAIFNTRLGVDASGQSFSCVIPVQSRTHSGSLHYRAVQSSRPVDVADAVVRGGGITGPVRPNAGNDLPKGLGMVRDALVEVASMSRVVYNLLGGNWQPLVMEVTLYPVKSHEGLGSGGGSGGSGRAIFIDLLQY